MPTASKEQHAPPTVKRFLRPCAAASHPDKGVGVFIAGFLWSTLKLADGTDETFDSPKEAEQHGWTLGPFKKLEVKL